MFDILSTDELREIAAEVVADMLEERKQRVDFFNGDLCKRMISDMREVCSVITSEDFAYFPDVTKDLFGWHDISNDDIKLFIDVMCDGEIGTIENYRVDGNCPFPNFTFEKCGIIVDVMIGQGSCVSLEGMPLPCES